MIDERDIDHVGGLIDAYAAAHPPVGVAEEEPGDGGVPRQLWDGPVNDEGWVQWRPLPSTLTPEEVAAVEAEAGVEFPPLFRAYLLSRFQLFDQLHSARHDQVVIMTPVPPDEPLSPLRELFDAWGSLVPASYLPFALWGDAWGPMCFDLHHASDGDRPVVWMDHELLVPLAEADRGRREIVGPLARPLYGSFREFLEDVFPKA